MLGTALHAPHRTLTISNSPAGPWRGGCREPLAAETNRQRDQRSLFSNGELTGQSFQYCYVLQLHIVEQAILEWWPGPLALDVASIMMRLAGKAERSVLTLCHTLKRWLASPYSGSSVTPRSSGGAPCRTPRWKYPVIFRKSSGMKRTWLLVLVRLDQASCVIVVERRDLYFFFPPSYHSTGSLLIFSRYRSPTRLISPSAKSISSMSSELISPSARPIERARPVNPPRSR